MGAGINGPFLLAPQDGKITIAWEGKVIGKSSIYFAQKGKKLREIKFKSQAFVQAPQRDDVYIHYAIVEDLELGAYYEYKLKIEDEEYTGSFKYLNDLGNRDLKILTISDSHSFENAKEFLATVEREKPNFIIHSGDISCGTGLQKKEYVNNWFSIIPEVLADTPIYYIPGNHDSGCIFDEIFMVPQRLYTNNCPMGNSYAFVQGDYHFSIVDSNPWGLYEMNAINSKASLDDHSQKLIDATITWLEKELSSPRAQDAKWRILVCHHPYTDEYCNKYIAPLTEKYNVNLLLSGHVHYYTKAISPHSHSLYISQGSMQVPKAYLALKTGERVLEEFPEVVDIGGNNFGILHLMPDKLHYRLLGYENKKEVLVDEIELYKRTLPSEIQDLQYRKIDEFGHLEISGKFYNPNPCNVLAFLPIKDNGQVINIYNFGRDGKTQAIWLEPEEVRSFKVDFKLDRPGKHHLIINHEELYLDILEREEISFHNFQVSQGSTDTNTYIVARMEVTNNMDREVFSFIPYYINGKVVDTKNLLLKPLEQCSIEFVYKVRRHGKYTVTIGNGLQREIYIAGSIKLIPLVLDKSGNGNHGLIHGNPRLIKEKKSTLLCLDKDTDYIEVPSTSSIIAEDGFTAKVEAAVQRLAFEHEMGHNPLMVRGKSVGWGATYLFRIVTDRTGGMRWGVCHDITEIPFVGGEVKLKEIADYVLCFNKEKGGNGYVNKELVAHIPGISKEEKLRQWEKEPIFIGYSYIGHIIPEIDRPKYYTHLKAKIKEAKFFTKSLNVEDIDNNKDDLGFWYDFKDVLTWGAYETNWRHPVPNLRDSGDCKEWQYLQLNAKVAIDPMAGVNLKIQTSDNKIYVKDELEVHLKDGENHIDLTNLKAGKFIKIICHLTGNLGEQGASVAEVFEFKILANNGKYTREFFWSTNADWQQGSFKGAVAIPPVDRLRDFPEYTDIIHG